jgi:hypothetical protein
MLERQFGSIITDIRDGDSSGQQSSMAVQRYTFCLIDGSKLFITERISREEIIFSQYDWVGTAGDTRLKLHSEPHEDSAAYQTATEPHHVHPPDRAKVHNITRYPNFHHQELSQILEMIFFHFLASGVMNT